jgi:hypothetical protein
MIAVSSDHAGINLKKAVLEYLEKNNCEERFAEGLSKILIDTDSYWYLFSYKDKRKVEEYTIFTFHNDWDMFFD